MKYLLGIDQGTTQTTAVIVNERGEMIEKNSSQLPARFPQAGWVEQEPSDIVRTVKEACAPLLDKYDISAVGFDNQGETFVVWDKDSGEAVTPAIVWQDTRGQSVCDSLASSLDLSLLRRKTGLLLDSYFSAPKLKWVFEYFPDIRKQARDGKLLFGTTETWVIWKLTNGKLHVTDPSTASRTLLFDMNRFEWDEDLLNLFDVPRSMLPEVKPSAGYIGDVDFGNGTPLPLHAMLVDQQAALFGQACFNAGEMKCSFGTGSFLLMNIGGEPRLSNSGLLTTVGWKFGEHTTYAFDGGIFVTGSAVQWLRDNLKAIPDTPSSFEAAKRSADLGVVVVPALQGLAAPHWRTDVRGAMFGLNRSTTSDDIVRATLDGIACRVYEVVMAMSEDLGQKPPHLKVDGGPSGNPYLMQMIADLLDIEVRVSAALEATAIGIANLAGVSALGTSFDDLAKNWKAETSYQPKITKDERGKKLEQWGRAVEAVKGFHS
ncbi:MAG: glycerol kinase GlpK [Anaerolineae bacterium]|nr:glycerol kinase GlpK [Anaerolineae bacterium]MBL8105176.1 glycerol kinase GlpK [Anaerolineales bacterium]MCC7188274.1 glycerol kinase GlpK [Anaerolineales bacterium]